jgi:hypothetical protein
VTPVDAAGGVSDAVTPVTQSSMDPLMRTTTLGPPLSISPSVVDTPPMETHIHMSAVSIVRCLICIANFGRF